MQKDLLEPASIQAIDIIPKTNRFQVNFVKIGFGDTSDDFLKNSVASVTCPGITMDIGEMEINGWHQYYYKNRIFSDLRIEFYENKYLTIRSFFYEYINTKQYNHINRVRYYADEAGGYASEISTTGGNKIVIKNSGNCEDIFQGVFPTLVEAINYNYASENEMIKTAVTFKYRFHLIK